MPNRLINIILISACTTNHPFLVQLPQQYYKNHYVDTDVMFGLTSVVIKYVKIFICHYSMLNSEC